jgi:hypothetical protein
VTDDCKVSEKAECYGHLDQALGQYENLRFLKDMRVQNRQYMGDGIDEKFVWTVNYDRGMKVLRKLIACYVPEDLVDCTFKYVAAMYDMEWRRYEQDKQAGKVKAGSEDYRNYSWRGNGPRPYFEELISTFMKKKKHRSIDDE